MVKHIKIESTLAKIANVVFETKDFNYAKQVALELKNRLRVIFFEAVLFNFL